MIPKLVILDGHTLNPGDLDWAPLRELADCVIHDRTPPELVVARATGAPIVLTNKTPVPRPVIDALPNLRFIGVLATGHNIVDSVAAAERGIPVANVPGYGTASVAEHVFALLLELARHTGHHAASVRDGRWSAQPDFCYWDHPLVELSGKIMGVVGFGTIGRAVAVIARAFRMHVIAAQRQCAGGGPGVPPTPPGGAGVPPTRLGGPGVPPTSAPLSRLPLDDLFATADIISLHCPLTPETQALVNARRLALMKPGALLINTSRGPLVVEQDLADALNSGRLAGAGLDVLSVEPPRPDNPLLTAKNCLITPHLAWATRAARQRLLDEVVENVRAFLSGRRRNVVN